MTRIAPATATEGQQENNLTRFVFRTWIWPLDYQLYLWANHAVVQARNNGELLKKERSSRWISGHVEYYHHQCHQQCHHQCHYCIVFVIFKFASLLKCSSTKGINHVSLVTLLWPAYGDALPPGLGRLVVDEGGNWGCSCPCIINFLRSS